MSDDDDEGYISKGKIVLVPPNLCWRKLKNERYSDHFNQSQLLADAKLKLKTTPVKTLIEDMDHIIEKESV